MNKRIFITASMVIALIFGAYAPAFAQSVPTPWITWRAVTYTPPLFTGRALPIGNSSVIVAVDMLLNGKPVDLSGESIYWYLNDQFLAGGKGMRRTSIKLPNVVGSDSATVRVSLPDYLGGTARTITIPIVAPRAIIENGYPSGAVPSTFTLHGFPYYFNVSDPAELNFSWTVSGKEPSFYNDPTFLKVNVDSRTPLGTAIPVQLRIENPARAFELSTKEISLLFKTK